MKKYFLIKLVVFTLFLSLFQACQESLVDDSPGSSAPELKSAGIAKTSYIVTLKDSELDTELTQLKGYENRQHAASVAADRILKRTGIADGEIEHVYGTALHGFSVKIPPGQLKRLQDDPSVERIEEDQVISLGNPKTEGTITAMAQTLPWGIARVNGGASGIGKTAWIIDTGVDLTHPDLTVDASRSAWFVSRVSSANDDNGHGTHVAGTIAALDNSIGVIGVAAGATVVPVKVLDRRGSGTTSGVIAGIDYVAANAASGDVANMSLGGGLSTTLDTAVLNASTYDDKNIYFALAAGNESDNANNHSPARVNGLNIYTISAFGEGDVWAYFSNFGNPPVDFCEPGVNILSCYKGGAYATMSGTSMATPHAAGLLLLGKYKTDGSVIGDPDENADPIKVYDGTITPSDNIAPTADFTFSISGLNVTFNDKSTDSDGNILTRSWNFGDNETSSSTNPSHTYATSGTYSVMLTVTDNDDAIGTIAKNITVSQGSSGEIVLTGVITGSKVKKASLTWTGATGATVQLYKNNDPAVTVTNSGSYNENLGKITTGTFTYYIIDELNIKSNTIQISVNN